MRRMLLVSLILTLVTGVAYAQTDTVAASDTGRSFGQAYDWKLDLIWAGLSTSTTLDTWSTFEIQGKCPTACAERDQFAAWAIHRGPSVAYPAGFAFDSGVIALTAWLRESNNPHLRAIWWLVPVAATAAHLLAFQGNRGTLDELQRYPWRAR